MKLQMKYNLLQILFWLSYCSIYGYVAVFLQYKGMTNSEIGIVTGVGAVSSIFVSPLISSLISKIKGLTIKKLVTLMYIIDIVSLIVITFIPLPAVLIMVLYIMIICLMISTVPLLSMICMNYLKVGQYINFGFARGLGSIAYASAAVVLGRLIDMINPTVCTYLFVASAILFFVNLFSFEDVQVEDQKVLDVCLRHPVLYPFI